MVDPLKFLTMINMATTNPSLLWGHETTNRDMSVHWYQINLEETIAFQRDTNLYASEEDTKISNWVKDILNN